MTSKNETTNSQIHEFKVLQNVFQSLQNEIQGLKYDLIIGNTIIIYEY